MKRYWLSAATMAVACLFAAGAMAAQSGYNTESSQRDQSTTAKHVMNWYGGPAYLGPPALKVTAALVRAGGGAENFSFPKAMVSMLGEKTVNAEVAKLQKQYGKAKVTSFLDGMTYAVNDGLKRATEAGITLPEAPADLKGVKLATTLVEAGAVSDGTFWAGHLFDKALSHDLHNRVMMDINENVSAEADTTTHMILNQAMFDVAQALGMNQVKLASLH